MNSYIWCPTCEEIREMVIDVMPGEDTTGKFTNPADLICGTCKLVIATTYSPKEGAA